MSNNNRELSQLASLVTVNDTTRSVSFGSSVNDLQVTGVTTFASNATFGHGANQILLEGETGIISTRRGPLYVDESKVIVVGAGLATSEARGAALRDELEHVGSQFIGAGVTVTLQLVPGDYYLGAAPLFIYNNGNGRLQIHGDVTGTKPGHTGNHFYNQAGVPNGQNPGLGNTGYSYFYDSSSPSGAYPNPMVGGQGLSSQSHSYNKSINDAYYRVRWYHESFNNDALSGGDIGVSTVSQTNPEVIPGAIVVGRGASNVGIDSIFIYTPALFAYENNVSGYNDLPGNGVAVAYESDATLYDVTVQGFNAPVVSTTGSSIGIHSCAVVNSRVGWYSILNSSINIFARDQKWGAASYSLNNTIYGGAIHRNATIRHAAQMICNNNGAYGLNFANASTGNYRVYGPLPESPSTFSNNKFYGIYGRWYGNFQNLGKMIYNYNGFAGVLADEGFSMQMDNAIVSYNGYHDTGTGRGIYSLQGSYISARGAGITTNKSIGVFSYINATVDIGGGSTLLYDNNGSTAGAGNAATTSQAVAANQSKINVVNVNDTYLSAAALLPDKDTTGNSNSYISDDTGSFS